MEFGDKLTRREIPVGTLNDYLDEPAAWLVKTQLQPEKETSAKLIALNAINAAVQAHANNPDLTADDLEHLAITGWKEAGGPPDDKAFNDKSIPKILAQMLAGYDAEVTKRSLAPPSLSRTRVAYTFPENQIVITAFADQFNDAPDGPGYALLMKPSDKLKTAPSDNHLRTAAILHAGSGRLPLIIHASTANARSFAPAAADLAPHLRHLRATLDSMLRVEKLLRELSKNKGNLKDVASLYVPRDINDWHWTDQMRSYAIQLWGL